MSFGCLTGMACLQLILAIDYCHRKGIANRDIKLDNTLLAPNPQSDDLPLLKLCGAFQCSCVLRDVP